MRFKRLPGTSDEWELALMRCEVAVGFVVLSAQVWARVALEGWMRQSVAEMLGPIAWMLALLLVCSSVIAAIRREWVLGVAAAVIGVGCAVIALLPELLHEGIYN